MNKNREQYSGYVRDTHFTKRKGDTEAENSSMRGLVKRWIRVDNGRLSTVVEYPTGNRIEVPMNKDGSVRWLEDTKKKNEKVEGGTVR